jgi:S-adenosylmethionine hydrolase
VLDPEQLVRLEKPVPRIDGGELIATVIGVDRFGNIQLGALSSDLEAIGMRLGDVLQLTLASGEAYLATRAGTFTDVGEHELLLFEDGSRHLAVACNRGSAASRLGVRGGEALRVSAAPAP